MYEITAESKDRLLVLKAIGRLATADYEALRPQVDKIAADVSGPLRVLLDWTDLTGWEGDGERSAFAMWAQEWSDVERVAIVSGDKFIEDGLQIGKILSKANVRHFQPADLAAARAWLTA